MKSFAYPYPNLFPFIDISSTWKFAVGESEYQDFKNLVIDWDYDAILKIYFKPLWNIEEIFKQANLEEIFDNSKIAFILISGPGQHGVLRKKILDYSLSSRNIEDSFNFEIDSKLQAKNLKIKFIIYTDEVKLNNFIYKKGSILYEEIASLDIEGESPRISLKEINFENNGYGNANWYIRFYGYSLSQLFNSTYTVYLNNQKKNMQEQLKNDIFLRDALKVDIISTIIQSVILNNDIDIDFDEIYPDESLGKVIKEWLIGFQVESKDELEKMRYKMQINYGEFKRKCQEIFCTSVIN